MCLFKVRAARRRAKRTPSLTYSTSERTSADLKSIIASTPPKKSQQHTMPKIKSVSTAVCW